MRKPQDKGEVAKDGKSSWRYDRDEKRLYIRLPGNADPNKCSIYVARYGIGMHIRNCDYLIIEDLTIRHYGWWDGWMRNCIHMVNCSHCVIQRCTILNGAEVQIRIKCEDGGDASDNLIQHCFLSDPLWGPEHTWDRGTSYSKAREGMGLSISGKRGNVIRYNRFGDEFNYCVDNLRVAYGGRDVNFDTDVYENYLEGAQDDVFETESCACCNVRIWGNTIVRARCAHSVVPVEMGPIYIFRNVYKDWSVGAVKTCGSKAETPGTVFFYHNTFVNTQGAEIMHGSLGGGEGFTNTKLRFVNNIFWGPGAKRPAGAEGIFENNFFSDPGLSDPLKLDFHLKQGSPCIDKGVRLPNINDNIVGQAPDIGAVEFGSEWTGKTIKGSLAGGSGDSGKEK